MTQLLLFDAPGVFDSAASPAVVAPVSRAMAAEPSESLPLYDPASGELHRMGDLARLVIARYDLVARRRNARRRQAV